MSRLLQDFRPFTALLTPPVRRRLWLGAALAALTALAGMALLGLSGWFITATALAGLTTATALAFEVFMPSAAIRLFALGRTAARYGERLITHDATLAVLAGLRERLFRGWAQPGAARVLAARPARLLFRLTADVDALDTLYLRVFVPLITALVAALAAGIALAFIHPLLGAAVFAAITLTGAAVTWAAARAAGPATLRRAGHVENLRSQVIDLVSGQTELMMAGQMSARQDRLMRLEARLADTDIALNRIETRAGLASGVLGALLPSAVLVAAAALAGSARIGAPGVAFAMLIAMAATEPLAPLRKGAVEFARARLAARRLGPRLAQEAPQARRRGPSAPLPLDSPLPPDVALRLEGVTLRHDGAKTAVLQGLSLTIPLGAHVALIGASGAGKSSLIQCLAGDLAPVSGQLSVLPAAHLTQRTELFRDTLRENLRLAAPGVGDDRLYQALGLAGLEADVRALPGGLETRLGEGGQGPSGGQARRLALARVVLNGAPLWLLDEPTEGLDAATARDVLDRLYRAAGERTVVTATHIRREAEYAHRLIVIDAGGIAATHIRGSPGFDGALDTLRPD